jgi:FdhE protein
MTLNMDHVNQVADAYLATAEGSSAERLRFLKGLWQIQSEIEAANSAESYEAPETEVARQALLKGRSLFLVSAPAVPPVPYAAAVSRIAAYVAGNAGLAAEQADALRAADFSSVISEDVLSTAPAAPRAFLAAASEILVEAGSEVAPATIVFVLASALVPFLTGPAARAFAAAGKVDRSVWNSGDCPVCGSSAAAGSIGESSSAQGGVRSLWCGMCHTVWDFDRIRCARCGTGNPDFLRYTHAEDDPAHRLHLCDQCHGYLKVVSENELGKRLDLLVEEAVMAPLDALALELGYTATGDGGSQVC